MVTSGAREAHVKTNGKEAGRVPEQNQKRKAVRVRSLRQRWILNSVVPVFALLALIVAGVSLGISNYY